MKQAKLNFKENPTIEFENNVVDGYGIHRRLLISCSQVGKLMTGNFGLSASDQAHIDLCRNKTKDNKELTTKQHERLQAIKLKEQEGPELSKTAKTMIREKYVRHTYGRRPVVFNKQLRKGILKEEEAIDLLSEVQGTLYINNKEYSQNGFLIGEWDLYDPIGKEVVDIKTSWDLFTFSAAELEAEYGWQLRAYMELIPEAEKASLAYCLVNTPEKFYLQELKRLLYHYDFNEDDPDYIKKAAQLEKNYSFEDIEPDRRVKMIRIDPLDYSMEDFKARYKAAVKFYNSLSGGHNSP